MADWDISITCRSYRRESISSSLRRMLVVVSTVVRETKSCFIKRHELEVSYRPFPKSLLILLGWRIFREVWVDEDRVDKERVDLTEW